MKIEDFNKLAYIRSELYHRFKESGCMCKVCRETIENIYYDLDELLNVFEKEFRKRLKK